MKFFLEHLCSVLCSALLIVCFSHENIEVTTREAGKDEIPLIETIVFKDRCIKFEVVANLHRPDFVLFFTKCNGEHGAENGGIYRLNPSKTAFISVVLKTAKGLTNINKIIPSGDKMLCISSSKNIAFYIDQNLKIEHSQSLVLGYKYVPHPDHPNMIMRFPLQSKNNLFEADFTNNYGDDWKLKYNIFRKFDWIPNAVKCVFIDINHSISLLTIESRSVDVKVDLVDDYKISENQILVIKSTVDKELVFSIIDAQKGTHNPTFFPGLLKIKEIKFFEYAFANYYLVLVHHDLITCLWTTSATPFHFVKKTCYKGSTSVLIESNIHIDKRVEGLIYFNLPSNEKEFRTHRTTDDGRYWDRVRFKANDLKTHHPFTFNFTLHNLQSIPPHFDWVDFQYEKLSGSFQPFMTIDGGLTWRPTPKSTSRVILLNYETVIISVCHDMGTINYSLDQGTTWLNHKLFPSKSSLLHMGRLSDTDLKVVIITHGSDSSILRFDILDFSNIFKFECQSNHFRQVSLPKSHGFCYRGKTIDKITRNPEIRCLNKLHEHSKVESICPCASDDFGCAFNFQSKGDICVLDSLSNLEEESFQCKKDSHLANDTCHPHEIHLGSIDASSLQCVENEMTDFIELKTKHKIYVSQLMLDGGHFIKPLAIEMALNMKANLSQPTAFDYLQQHLYNYLDKYITRFPLESQHIQVLYFRNDPIIDMAYDPLTHALIYLTNLQKLKILSLITSYEHVVYDNVTWFGYSSHQRLLSMVVSKNLFCYCELLGKPKCIRSPVNLLKAFVDLQNSMVLLLTTSHTLIIRQFVKDPIKLQPLTHIYGVSDFAVFDNHLYYLLKGQLMYQNLRQKNLNVLLIKNLTFTHLILHRKSFSNFKYICENLKCPFSCEISLVDEVTCGCPSPTVLVNNTCVCPKHSLNCTLPQCAGFRCNNSKCLLDNVKCNGVDDCGDQSDESGCNGTCSADNHLCKDKCFLKDAVCGPVQISVINPIAEKRIMFYFYTLLIILTILACLVHPFYPELVSFYKKLTTRSQTSNIDTHALEYFDYDELFGAENESRELTLA
ncbi:Sortilin-related receptor [Thelohanellus kitauei]|uniref:Sortilin-related receptor n=1 Tax=Thelohanellus kitauei TaxID=669202 RepID=A0A0C2JBH1_THEKT|nr:Sortilin-related receptor [Thelohanellus kitauei]